MKAVVTFGEVLWDVFEIDQDTYRRVIGGAPANLAVVLARLSVRSRVIGAVGADAFGDALRALIAKEGVDVSSIARLPERTGLAFVMRRADGEPTFLFYRRDTADMMLTPKLVRPSAFRGAGFAVCGTSTLVGKNLRATTWRFVELAARAKAHLVVDLNVRAHLWKSEREMRSRIAELVSRAALVKASTADLDALGGERFLSKIRATALITAGAGVARAIGEHGTVEKRARAARCVDATGAGDAFLGGALAVLTSRGAFPGTPGWRDSAVFSDALAVGHMLGRQAVSKVGAVTGVVGCKLP